VQKAALVETQQPAAAAAAAAVQPIKNPHQKTIISSFSESFISSGKQGGRATILSKLHCNKRNLNNLGKTAVMHFAFSLSSAAGAMPNSACRSLRITVLVSNSNSLLIICSPHVSEFPSFLRLKMPYLLIHHILFIHSFSDGQLVAFWFLAIVVVLLLSPGLKR
jgi:hypothetical protein